MEAETNTRKRESRSVEDLRSAPITAHFSYKEAALYLGISIRTLYNLVAAKQGPAKHSAPGVGIWFVKADLDAWFKSGHTVTKAFQ